MAWTAADMPSQAGRRIVVTGANSGVGRATARELARAGAAVVLACRDVTKGEAALADVRAAAAAPDSVRLEQLDLADLASVRDFAARIGDDRVDVLINNAGIMAPPRGETVDGFESQLGINHLGHFALTGRLLGPLRAAPAPRVVTLTSGVHRFGWLRFSDLQMRRWYNNWVAYAQSKLANLTFTLELQRRAAAAGWDLLSLAAHPGYSATNLQFAGPATAFERQAFAVMNRVVAQSADAGALPTLYAATIPFITGGSLVGPDGFMELTGHPRVTSGAPRAYDEAAGRRLWEESERLTGVRYEFRAGAGAGAAAAA